MERPDEQRQRHAEQHGDQHGRDGVGEEHLEQLDIRGDHGEQVAAATPLELRGRQAAQRAEHAVADEREQLECDEMVASLLAVAHHAAEHGGDSHEAEHPGHRQRGRDAVGRRGGKRRRMGHGIESRRYGHVRRPVHDGEHAVARQHGNGRREQVSNQAEADRERHVPRHGAHEPHQPQHHRDAAASAGPRAAALAIVRIRTHAACNPRRRHMRYASSFSTETPKRSSSCWARQSSAYAAPPATSSPCVPASATAPSRST